MPDNEKSFRDRQAKSQLLRDTTEEFTPDFEPPDISLNPTNFQTTLTGVNGIEAANSAVEGLLASYTTSSEQRVALVKSVRALATQALGYVKSNTAWATQFKAVKSAADKMRGMGTPAKVEPPADVELPTPTPTPPPGSKSRNKGQLAYVELAAHLQSFVEALMACPGYAPPAAITVATFSGHLSQFKSFNGGISVLSGKIVTARAKRARLYIGPGGLEEKFQAIKNAVKGQYGQTSDQYNGVKGLTW